MKASHHAFLLLALLPIPHWVEENDDIRGMLTSRLFHATLDFILRPLKKAAEIGIMMSDPLGSSRLCYTPLAAYIVDTPESAMIAGVAGKTSSMTMASYEELGDPFRHEPRTAQRTLDMLEALAVEVDPWHFAQYIAKAKGIRLNGVHRPFWRDWALSCPSRFLTTEMLHYWHKFFLDHDLKWCINALGNNEIDFRFMILWAHTGMRHFKEGVSKIKQVTGREQRDIQRYIIPVIADAVPKDFLIAIRSLQDFRYYGQSPVMGEDTLTNIDKSLQCFHDHKQAIIDAGARRGKKGTIHHFKIPKLEFMQSVVPDIRQNGVCLQWTADVTEHAHIEVVKTPVDHGNNRENEQQICRYLDRQDSCQKFDLATSIKEAGVDFRKDLSLDKDGGKADEEAPLVVSDTSSLLAHINPVSRLNKPTRSITNYFLKALQLEQGMVPAAPSPHRTFISGNIAIHLHRDHVGKRMTVEDTARLYKIPDLKDALLHYLHRVDEGDPASRNLIGGRRAAILRGGLLPFQHLEVWHSVQLQGKAYHQAHQILPPETLNASPPCKEWPEGRGDPAIIDSNSQKQWPYSGLDGKRAFICILLITHFTIGHIVGQVRLIMKVVPKPGYSAYPGTEGFLMYVHKFQLAHSSPDPASALYHLKRARRSDGSLLGDVVPLGQLRARADLVPRFGTEANRQLTKETVLEYSSNFWLNKYFTKELFFALSDK